MKKIVLVSSKDYNFYNFRSKFILELVSLGFEVVLVCPYGEKIDYFTDRGCRFIDLPMDRRGTNPFRDLKLIMGYNKIFKDEKPDLVLTYTTKCSVYAGIACRWRKIPYIVNNAGLIAHDRPKSVLARVLNMLYKLGFKKSSCMMYQNSQERDYLNGLLKKKVHYRDLPGSGVDLDVFQYAEYPSAENEIKFNYVGRIVELKGIREFLACAEKIKEKYKNTRFVIYGGYDNLEYKEKIAILEQKGVVEYGGVLLDMKPAIKEASAVIHASYYEGMTNVVLEHGAMGRPSIGSNIPGVADGIDDGVTGYTFEVKNTDELIDAVERFINLPYESRVEMGKNARRKMEKEFDRNKVTSIYLEEINKLLGGDIK